MKFVGDFSMFFFQVAYVDFNTIAMIACCVAKHNLCGTCGGASLSHDEHDKIFGGKKVYLVCLLIWVVSFLTLLPDIMGVGLPISFYYKYHSIFRLQVPMVGLTHHLDVKILAWTNVA